MQTAPPNSTMITSLTNTQTHAHTDTRAADSLHCLALVPTFSLPRLFAGSPKTHLKCSDHLSFHRDANRVVRPPKPLAGLRSEKNGARVRVCLYMCMQLNTHTHTHTHTYTHTHTHTREWLQGHNGADTAPGGEEWRAVRWSASAAAQSARYT